MKKFYNAIMISIFSSSISYAQDSCTPLLQDGIRNNFYEKYDKSFIDDFHSAMCSENTNQIEKAKSLGFDLGFSKFILNFAGSSKKIAAYQSAMCESDARISRGSTFYETTRNHISVPLAESYIKCIQIQSGGIIYNVSNGIDGDSVTIEIGYDSRIRAGKGSLTISDIVVSPEKFSEKISCEGPMVEALSKGPIDVATFNGFQTLTCRPKGDELMGKDNDFSIFVHTSLGVIEGYVNPYHNEKDDRIDYLEKMLKAKIKVNFDELKSIIDESTEKKISNIEFRNMCNYTSNGNICEIKPPKCPEGFSEAYKWQNSWNGGRCGNGSICSVCIRISN